MLSDDDSTLIMLNSDTILMATLFCSICEDAPAIQKYTSYSPIQEIGIHLTYLGNLIARSVKKQKFDVIIINFRIIVQHTIFLIITIPSKMRQNETNFAILPN